MILGAFALAWPLMAWAGLPMGPAGLLIRCATPAEASAGEGPRTLRVGRGGHFATLAQALAAAAPGDTVRLSPGLHPGVVIVDRRLVLIGEPGAVLDGERRGTVVTVRADSVQLRGLTIRRSGLSLDRDEAAVKLERCRGCAVIETRILEALHGIYLLESHDARLERNEIAGDTTLVESRRGNGIHLFNSTGNRLERNTIRSARDGIYFSFASHNDVIANDVARVRYGLHYMYSDDNRFERNRFARNAAGAAIMFSKRIVFRENVFAEHIGYRAYGILLQTVDNVIAERNRIEGNLTGMFLDGSVANTFRHNVIVGNGIGVDLLASAEQNDFTGNVIAANRTAVRNVLGAGENRWAVDGRGNYWGDRAIFDLDRDGIGDRPYTASDPFATLAGMRPVLELFAGTPAALALSWAERAFPVFDLPQVIDPAPLATAPDGWRVASSAPADAAEGSRVILVILSAASLTILVILAQRMRGRRRATLPGGT